MVRNYRLFFILVLTNTYIWKNLEKFEMIYKNEKAEQVFHAMYDNDNFSKMLGIEPILIDQGHCILKMKISDFMLNGFKIAHGGVAFSIADSALAFASNSYGKVSVSLDCSIKYPAPLLEGDEIYAEAKMISMTRKTGVFDVEVSKDDGTLVALFRGTIFRTDKEF